MRSEKLVKTLLLMGSLFLVLGFIAPSGGFAIASAFSSQTHVSPSTSSYTPYTSYFYQGYSYSPAKAVSYAQLIDTKYYHTSKYPAGINENISQENLDSYQTEDCAHFVSEALIAGGLTALASNPPGDNLTDYKSGFIGSYGIVGVYRLADYLAGYDLPVFPANATDMQVIGYQPIPGSYAGSPHASVYYVTNESMMPSYFLSAGDVIVDGGAGNGHSMFYIGGGTVIQTDPAGKLVYSPGLDYNISFHGMLTLNEKNVTSLYIHMPTISATKTVSITVIYGQKVYSGGVTQIPDGTSVKLIGSFPDGVGFGNYSYKWYDNGKLISTSQIFNYKPGSGVNNIELEATGSNGTAISYNTIEDGNSGFVVFGHLLPYNDVAVVSAVVAIIVGLLYLIRLRARK